GAGRLAPASGAPEAKRCTKTGGRGGARGGRNYPGDAGRRGEPMALSLPFCRALYVVAASSKRVEMNLRSTFFTIACLAGLSGVAHAQKAGDDDIPKAYRPPPGMCRIWLDKVPPKQQPAPTDCPTAVKNKPAN